MAGRPVGGEAADRPEGGGVVAGRTARGVGARRTTRERAMATNWKDAHDVAQNFPPCCGEKSANLLPPLPMFDAFNCILLKAHAAHLWNKFRNKEQHIIKKNSSLSLRERRGRTRMQGQRPPRKHPGQPTKKFGTPGAMQTKRPNEQLFAQRKMRRRRLVRTRSESFFLVMLPEFCKLIY